MPDLVSSNAVALIALAAWLALSVYLAQWANARIARLIAEDDITEPIRAHYRKKLGTNHWFVKWIHCPWCCGWWTALPVTSLAWFPIAGWHVFWLFPLAFLTVAHSAGRLNHHHGG